jgi:CHAD domain-containing protein
MAKPLKVKKILPNQPVHKAAVRILRTRLKEFYSHWPDPNQIPTLAQVHNMRISGKRLRYTAESLREFFPDRLALLIDLLKRSQDLLGDIQDCVTQRVMIEEDLRRLRRRHPQSNEIAVLETLTVDYDQRYSLLLTQYHDIWIGLTNDEFRDCLKAMIIKIGEPDSNFLFPVYQTGHEPRAETVVNIDHRYV